MKKFIDIRVMGNTEELRDFIRLCKVIQRLGRTGSSRKISIVVDGDGSGRLSFHGINNGELVEFNSDGIDVNNIEEMWIGE